MKAWPQTSAGEGLVACTGLSVAAIAGGRMVCTIGDEIGWCFLQPYAVLGHIARSPKCTYFVRSVGNVEIEVGAYCRFRLTLYRPASGDR
jgi:hypothetical protein